MELLEWIDKYGFSWGLAALFIIFVIYYYKNLDPRLEKMEQAIYANLRNEEELKRIADNSNKALVEVAKSSDNVANSLTILNVTMKGQNEIMKLLHEDTKETQLRLYTHDDRAEKIYTELREIKAKVNE